MRASLVCAFVGMVCAEVFQYCSYASVTGISGLVAEYIVGIDLTRVQFPADALSAIWGWLKAHVRKGVGSNPTAAISILLSQLLSYFFFPSLLACDLAPFPSPTCPSTPWPSVSNLPGPPLSPPLSFPAFLVHHRPPPGLEPRTFRSRGRTRYHRTTGHVAFLAPDRLSALYRLSGFVFAGSQVRCVRLSGVQGLVSFVDSYLLVGSLRVANGPAEALAAAHPHAHIVLVRELVLDFVVEQLCGPNARAGTCSGCWAQRPNHSGKLAPCATTPKGTSAPQLKSKMLDPGRTRTCNVWFRRPTPYPLGHRARHRYINKANCTKQQLVTAWGSAGIYANSTRKDECTTHHNDNDARFSCMFCCGQG